MRSFIVCGLLIPFGIHADILHLTNGRSFKGEIVAESADAITFREQGLTLTFKRSKIARIEKTEGGAAASPAATPQRPSREPPPAFVGFFDEIRKLESAQLVNQRAKSEVVKLQRSLDSLGTQKSQYEAKRNTARANTKDAKSTKEYNAYIREANEYYAKIVETRDKITAAKKQLTKTQASLNRYAEQAMATRMDYQRRLNQYAQEGQDPVYAEYFNYIHQKLGKHEAALATAFQAFKGSSLMVRAHLNNKVAGTFIVDTGATMVLFHKGLAQKLGINLNGPKITTTLADGTKTDMVSVNLKSVTVNGMTAFNVASAVSDHPPGEGVDGLLGMSFLSQFDFQLDIQNGRLRLNARR